MNVEQLIKVLRTNADNSIDDLRELISQYDIKIAALEEKIQSLEDTISNLEKQLDK